MEARSNKLQAKDLINVGIFTAIYFVIFFAGMMLGYIPIFIPLLGLVCPILCGIPFMLYLTKVKKFGICVSILNQRLDCGKLIFIIVHFSSLTLIDFFPVLIICNTIFLILFRKYRNFYSLFFFNGILHELHKDKVNRNQSH